MKFDDIADRLIINTIKILAGIQLKLTTNYIREGLH